MSNAAIIDRKINAIYYMNFYTDVAFDFNLTVIFRSIEARRQRVYCTASVLDCSLAESVDFVVFTDECVASFLSFVVPPVRIPSKKDGLMCVEFVSSILLSCWDMPG